MQERQYSPMANKLEQSRVPANQIIIKKSVRNQLFRQLFFNRILFFCPANGAIPILTIILLPWFHPFPLFLFSTCHSINGTHLLSVSTSQR